MVHSHLKNKNKNLDNLRVEKNENKKIRRGKNSRDGCARAAQ
jgi:hypothetical protein